LVGLIGSGAGEPFGLAVVGEFGSQDEAFCGEVDFAALELFEHIVEGGERVGMFLHGGADLVHGGFGADAPGDIGLVTDGGAEVADFDVGHEFFGVVVADGGNEVGGVGAAAVALVLVDAFAVLVEGPTAAAGDTNVAVFALDVVTATGAEVDRAVVAAAFGVGEVTDIDDDFDAIVIEEGEVHVGGFAVIVPEEAVTGGDDAGGDVVPAEDMAEVIDVVDAPVTHFAVAPIPLPMPVVMELLAHDGGHGGWAGPEVVVDMIGNGGGGGDLADGFTGGEFGAMDPLDFAVASGLDIACAFLDGGAGALLGAGLDDPVVFAGSLDHFTTFPDGMADGFFDVDVFSCLAGPDGQEGVPMVGGGDDDGVEVIAVQGVADVAVAFESGGVAFLFLAGFLDSLIEDHLVGVAEGDDVDIGQAEEAFDVAVSLAADSGHGDADLVIGAAWGGPKVWEGGKADGGAGGGGEATAEELASMQAIFHSSGPFGFDVLRAGLRLDDAR